MKIFTIENGDVTEGAMVDTFTLSNGVIAIPAILVGERGRGRQLGVLPVHLQSEQYTEWKEKGKVRINFAAIGKTKSGNPKLFACNKSGSEKCICVFRTMIGFRGGNSHTGDKDRNPLYYIPEYIMKFGFREKLIELNIPIKEEYTKGEKERYLSLLKEHKENEKETENTQKGSGYFGMTVNYDYDKNEIFLQKNGDFLEFPGDILATGTIAQGDAGRMGSGNQHVAVMSENKVFRTGYTGRLYGAPSAHYYIFRNGEILSATSEERKVVDLF